MLAFCTHFVHLHNTHIFSSFSLTLTHSHHTHSFRQNLSLCVSHSLPLSRACERALSHSRSYSLCLSVSLRVCVCLSLSLQIQEQPAGVLDLLLDALEEYHLWRGKKRGVKNGKSARVYFSGCLLDAHEEYHPKNRGKKKKEKCVQMYVREYHGRRRRSDLQ